MQVESPLCIYITIKMWKIEKERINKRFYAKTNGLCEKNEQK